VQKVIQNSEQLNAYILAALYFNLKLFYLHKVTQRNKNPSFIQLSVFTSQINSEFIRMNSTATIFAASDGIFCAAIMCFWLDILDI